MALTQKQLDSLVNFRYKITGADILLPKEDPIKIEPEALSDIQIIKDFDKSFFPIFKTVLALDPQTYFKIIDNKTEVRFRIRLEYYKYKENTPLAHTTKLIFNDIFTAFIDEDTPSLDPKLMRAAKEKELTRKDGKVLNSFGSSIELYLFKEETLNSSKKVINKVISKGTMTDAVAYLLSKSGVKNVLMDIFDNKSSYEEIILPPFTILGNLTYLEKQYGFYNTYATMFFDFDTAYIVDRTNKCTAYKKNEQKRIILNISAEATKTGFYSGTAEERDSYTIIITRGSVAFANDTISQDQIQGTNVMSIDSMNGDSTEIKTSTVNRGDGGMKVLVNKYGNKYLESCEKYDKEENSMTAAVDVVDFDMSFITPNKEYSFVFEDNALNKTRGGIYRVSKVIYDLKKHGDFYSIEGLMTFRSNGTKRTK